MSRAYAILLYANILTSVQALPDEDFVKTLPGYGAPPTPQFSGFLNASAAEPGTMLHYWFAATSEPEWKTKPVVLWLNGGPGASSLLGMLQEQGPLIIDRSGGLLDNPWAWTKIANLVALESPGGVGYSYCEAMKTGGSCANTDISTAKAAHAALVDFFAKFPELSGNAFFITGESYAGVYCPTLAAEIVKGNEATGASGKKINLVGMAVGDPCTDNKAQADSMDMLWWAHKNGLVPERAFSFLWDECGMRAPSALAAGSWSAERVAQAAGANGAAAAARVRPAAAVAALGRRRAAQAGAPANCTAVYRKFLISSSKGVSQSWDKAFINELSFYSPAAEFRFDLPGAPPRRKRLPRPVAARGTAPRGPACCAQGS
jgi:serine carboxypeptidase-like clade 1